MTPQDNSDVLLALIIVFSLAIPIAYALSMAKCVRAVEPSNRIMAPGLMWLYVIPGWNILWQFVVIYAVDRSLSKASNARGIPTLRSHAVLGYLGGILGLAAFLPNPLMAGFAALISFALYVTWWVNAVKRRGTLNSTPAPAEGAGS